MSGSTSNNSVPPGLFEAKPNDIPVPGEKRLRQQQQTLPLVDPNLNPSSISSLSSTAPVELNSGLPAVPLAAPLTSVVKPGTNTLVGGGTLQAGETTTLNQLAGDQPIEGGTRLGPGNLPRTPLFSSGTQGTLAAGENTTLNQLAGAQPIESSNTVLGSGTNNHPRTPSFPGAYPGTESPLHYPPISAIPSMAMNTLQTVNETIQTVGEKVVEYVPESVSSYFPHSRKASSDPAYQPEDSASPPTGTLVPDWPREAAKLDQAPTPANVPNMHPGAQAALDDAEYVQDKALSDAYGSGITHSNNSEPLGSVVASNAAYVKDKTMNAVSAVGETLGKAGSTVVNNLPTGVAAYLPNPSNDSNAQPQNRAPTSSTSQGTPAYLGSLAPPPGAPDHASSYGTGASTDASTRTLHGSIESPGNFSDGNTTRPFNHEGPHPAPTKLPSFLAGQPLDTSFDLGFLNNSGASESQNKPLARALDHKPEDATPTRVAEPEWKKTAVFPLGHGDTQLSQSHQNKGDVGAPRTSSLSSAGISSTTATPGHEVPAPNVSRIQTHPPAGLSSNKTADVAATTSIPPLTKPGTHDMQIADSDQAHGPSLDEAAAKPLPTTPAAGPKLNTNVNMHPIHSHSPAGVLNGGGAEVLNEARKEGIEIVPAVPGEHGHVGYAREVKKGNVDPLVRKGDVWDMKMKGDADEMKKLTKAKPADSFEVAKEHGSTTTTKGDHTHPSTTTNAPTAIGNTAGSSHPQTTPSKLTKTAHAERGVRTHPDIPSYTGDRHLDPNSHLEAPSPKKPGLMDKIKGEMKIVTGKLGGKEEKVEEGRRLMGKIQN